jgi:hypothetical protein
MLVTKCVRDVQELKTHASESGQMHAQHLAICGQVIKKKCTVSWPKMNLRATVQDGVSRIHPQLLFFAAKVQISTSESGPKWRFRTRKAAATFLLSIHQYGRSFFLFISKKWLRVISFLQ